VPPSVDADLLDAGARALTAHGLHGATLERIAEYAGVSRVTLHRRGVSKNAIVEGLVARAVEDYQRRMWPVLTSAAPPAERLEAALATLCEAAEEHLGLLAALQERRDDVFHEPGRDALTRTIFTDPLQRILEEGVRAGVLRAPDPGRTATVLFNLVAWTYIHLREGHAWSPGDAREAVLDVALRGVIPRP
jgi:AcrR family transcriptional regulator